MKCGMGVNVLFFRVTKSTRDLQRKAIRIPLEKRDCLVRHLLKLCAKQHLELASSFNFEHASHGPLRACVEEGGNLAGYKTFAAYVTGLPPWRRCESTGTCPKQWSSGDMGKKLQKIFGFLSLTFVTSLYPVCFGLSLVCLGLIF